MKFVIGTRGSKLSLAQTNWVVEQLQKANSEIQFEIKTIKTVGDTDARPLFAMNQKGIFEKEIDRAVAENRIDFAVHSLKDVPSELPENLSLSCIPKRESFNDVFISKDASDLDSIKSGATIGTSSLRRAVQVSRKRPDVFVKPIRGNVETRIKKIDNENFDAVVLAEAGIKRLKLDVNFTKLSVDDFPPSPGQGALGIVAREDDQKALEILKSIEDPNSRVEADAERAFSSVIESGCRFPVGALAQTEEQFLSLTVVAYSIDGKKVLRAKKTGTKNNPQKLGFDVAKELEKQGVRDLALNWRQKVEEWNKL